MLKGLKPLDFATNRKKVAVLLAERLEITWFATNRKKVVIITALLFLNVLLNSGAFNTSSLWFFIMRSRFDRIVF